VKVLQSGKVQKIMGKLWTILTHVHSLAGPTVMLLYPLYASVQAMESPSKLDDEQWLAYWILYSFITLVEMLLESLIYWLNSINPSHLDLDRADMD
jgi:receptor expression-enhancing protein 5/6